MVDLDIRPMGPFEALEYAPQWGSYIRNGDPGACMYGLDAKGRPADAFNRDLMLEQIDSHCLPYAEEMAAKGDPDFTDDPEKLQALRAYLAALTFPDPPEPHTFGEPEEVNGHNVEEMTRHYVTAMLWSSNDESSESGGEPFDSHYDESDLHPTAWAEAEADCRLFLEKVGHLLTSENLTRTRSDATVTAMAGHDFWLTRAGHGAGFWDGDWASDAQNGLNGPLTQACKEFGELDVYLGDDGMIHT